MTTAAPLTVMYVANSEKIGGGNRVLMDLVGRLDPERYAPLIVTPREGALPDWARAQGVDTMVVRDGDWTGRLHLVRRAFALARLARRRRVALVHAAAPTCYRACGLAGEWLRLPRVCHLGFPPAPGELEWSFRFGPELVIACYEGQAHEVEGPVRAARPTARVVAVPNGIDTRLYRPAPVNWDVHQSLRRGASQVVLIAGHLSDVKGYPAFLRAAARVAERLPDCRFLALGGETTGPGPRARYEQMAAELGIAARVDFLGFRSDVADVLRAADLVVLPSLDEGLPLAILEAMACGKPVVATPVGGVPEAVVDEVTGILVPPDAPDLLAAAMLRVLTDRDRAVRMGHEGRRRVQTAFAVERLAAHAMAIYDGLTGRAARRSTTDRAVAATACQS